MLVINKIGLATVKSVRLESNVVTVRLVEGQVLVYRRTENESNSSKKG